MMVVCGAVAACAQVLSYDDYRERVAPSAIDSGVTTDVDAAPEQEEAGDADAADPPIRPPARPAADAKPSGTGKTLWLAVRKYYLGTVDPSGGPAEHAWKLRGYDLDGVCTNARESAENTGTCLRPMMAQQDSLLDGLRCRDNNFGRHIGAMVRASMPDAEDVLNGTVNAGTSTWIFRIDDVDPGADDGYAPAVLYRTADERMTAAPKWDGTDVRTVLSDSVIDRDLAKPVLTFPAGYIAGNVWVSGEPGAMRLMLPISRDVFITMNMQSTFFTLELDAERKSGKNGVVAGAIPVSEIETILKPIAASAGFCPGSTIYESVLKTAAKAPDVVVGAPKLQDTTRTCDGLSVGVGFDVAPVMPSKNVIDPLPPRPGRCDDAGM
jgi:hypothetical protein